MRTHRVILFLLTLLLIASVPASAQWIPCLGDPVAPATTWTAPDLPTVPELITSGGKLRATVVLTDEQQRLTFKTPPGNAPADNNVIKCAPQYVRVFKGIGAMPPIPKPTSDYPDPMPGPTLRARVGDIIELTFLNQIDPATSATPSTAASHTGSGCDETSTGYPKVTTTPPRTPIPIASTVRARRTSTSTARTRIRTRPATTSSSKSVRRCVRRIRQQPIVTAASVAHSRSAISSSVAKRSCRRQVAAASGRIRGAILPAAYTTQQKELLQEVRHDAATSRSCGPSTRRRSRRATGRSTTSARIRTATSMPKYTRPRGLRRRGTPPHMRRTPAARAEHAAADDAVR